jgi:CRP-like cAMP-binding protein
MYNAGDILCRQNRIEDVLYVILVGEVEIVEERDETKKLKLGILHTGDLVGEIAALTTVPRIASVYANKPTVALEVTASDFAELLKKTPLLSKIAGKSESKAEFGGTITQMMSCWKNDKLN